MLRSLSSVKLNREVKENVWEGDKLGHFTVKITYEWLANYVKGHNNGFKQLWMIKTRPNVVTIMWRVLLERISTRMS